MREWWCEAHESHLQRIRIQRLKETTEFFSLLHYLQCWPKLGTLAMGGSQAAVDSSGAARSPIRPRISSRPSSGTGWNFGGGRLMRLMVSRKIGQGSYGRALAGALMAGHHTGGHGELSGIREQPEIWAATKQSNPKMDYFLNPLLNPKRQDELLSEANSVR